jgi:hypothetical protein
VKVTACIFFALAAPVCAAAAELRGVVVDPSGAGVPGARLAAVNRVGVVAETVAGPSGGWALSFPDDSGVRITVTSTGFATRTLDTAETARIELQLAAQVDSVRVVGSAIDIPASEMPASVGRFRAGNPAPQRVAGDGPAPLPARATFSQTGRAAAWLACSFGADTRPQPVQIDGVPVNTFGNFDFAHPGRGAGTDRAGEGRSRPSTGRMPIAA